MSHHFAAITTVSPHLRQSAAANEAQWLSVTALRPPLGEPQVRLLRPANGANPGHFCLSGKLSDVCRALEQWAAQDALPATAHG